MTALATVAGAILSFAAPAHDDGLPGNGKVPLHARDTMRAFALEHHHNEHLAAQSVTPCNGGVAGGFPCQNVDLLAFLPLDTFGQGNANDIWGWTHTGSGREFAIMGLSNGTIFVEVTDPVNAVYLGFLPRPPGANPSSWRDIKVFNDHAFIGSEANTSGLQVMNLNQLLNVPAPPVTFVQLSDEEPFLRSHNIVINEDTGYLYGVGANTCAGGLTMVDIVNPAAPVALGCYSGDGYTHDAQCVIYNGPDTDYQGHEICFAYNTDTLTIVDVTDKAAPVQVSRTGYANRGYTHQGWLTGDQQYLLMDDETDERDGLVAQTRTLVWDVRDLDNPVHMNDYLGVTTSIDHNQYIVGDRAYQANYSSGLRILDISDIANGNLSEVGFFDVWPADDGTHFSGAWSVYPFFGSGVVVLSGIEQGLFVLMPNEAPPSQPPQVSILNPPDLADNLNGTVAIQIQASDAEDDDASLDVDWNVDGGPWQNATSDGGGLYSASWDTTGVANGAHTIGARAIDSDNDTGFDSVSVDVNNATPAFTVAVSDVAVIAGKGNRNTGQALIEAMDEGGNPLDGVNVSGEFSGDWSGSRGGVTGADGAGQLRVETPKVKNLAFVAYCVTGASLGGWAFDSAGSSLCADSNGSGGAFGEINGTVTDSGTGAPIENAGVSTDTGENASTNASGQYTMGSVPVGNRTVSVNANGYQPDSSPASVVEGAPAVVDFQLIPEPAGGGTGSVKGTVYSSSGAKLADATVAVLGGNSALSNKGGKYHIQGVQEGAQQVTASLPGYLSQTQVVEVAAGTTLTVDFTLAPQ